MTPAEAAQHPPLCCKKVSPIYTALLNAFLAAGITPHIACEPDDETGIGRSCAPSGILSASFKKLKKYL